MICCLEMTPLPFLIQCIYYRNQIKSFAITFSSYSAQNTYLRGVFATEIFALTFRSLCFGLLHIFFWFPLWKEYRDFSLILSWNQLTVKTIQIWIMCLRAASLKTNRAQFHLRTPCSRASQSRWGFFMQRRARKTWGDPILSTTVALQWFQWKIREQRQPLSG